MPKTNQVLFLYPNFPIGDLVHVELQNDGDHFSKGDVFATLESVKGVSDVYTPLTGTAIEFNPEIKEAEDASAINSDAEDTWLVKLQVSNPEELKELMDKAKYDEYLKSL